MKVTVIQNSPSVGIGLVGSVLERDGFVLETIEAQTADFEAIASHGSDLFIILGSPRGVYERQVSWIDAEFHFTRRLIAANAPLFGICFGGQMIAAALGARVGAMAERHRGWRVNDVATSEVWKGPWFRWHGDCFEPPQGADIIAVSDGIFQGFQKGRAVGVQFHPEVSVEAVRLWVREGQDLLARDGCDGEQLIADSIPHCERVGPRLDGLLADVIQRCGG